MGTLAIVGAGCSGTLVAVQLLSRHAPAGTRILLFERRGSFGPGLAYSTPHPEHRLNVPASAMSAFPDRPDHFVEWARARDPRVRGSDFLPRRLYGAYLAELLDCSERVGRERGVVLERESVSVCALRRPGEGGGLWIETAAGGAVSVDAAVLALGNLPRPPADGSFAALRGSPRLVADPWAPGALDCPPDEPVLLVGTGLTMYDVAVALASAGHRAPIHAVSRRGLVPRAHRPVAAGAAAAPIDPCALRDWPRSALGLLRRLRTELAAAAERGCDWRDALASLRAGTPALWQSLPLRERRRFLEHLRPFWDVHRHRAAPQTAAIVRALRASGQLEILASRVTACRPEASGKRLRVSLRLRRGGERHLSVSRWIDCTGSCADLEQSAEPLVRQLLAHGLARPDPLGLGFATDADGALLDAEGRADGRLFTLGPLRRGELWECTAVPEIRVAAERLAMRLACVAPRIPHRAPARSGRG